MERILKSARESSSLNLSNRSLSEVPGEVYNNLDTGSQDDKWWEGVDLQKLILAHNNLEALREDLRNLSSLVVLNISHNQISSLPATRNLSSIFCSRNNLLSSIPADIGMLSKLGTLDLHSNQDQLKEYPVGACKLKLYFLDLSNNALSGLPPELGTMITLRKLLLSGNPMRTLRSSLVTGPTSTLLKYLRSRLSSDEEASGSGTTPTKDDQISAAKRLSQSSKELNLSGLGVTSVPPAAWETSDVMKLDLSKNSIEDLPNELSLCSSLQALILSNNKIKKWPGMVVSSLPSLSSLKLDNNPLTEISSTDLEALSKLEVLDLSGNASCLTEPSVVSSLPRLQELYLRRMKLQEFPIGLLRLKQLRILNLSQNHLTTVPEGIKDFTALIELDLSDNNITALPAELGLLEPTLQVLRLDGNPLRSIRRPILDRGTKAVLMYLKERLPSSH